MRYIILNSIYILLLLYCSIEVYSINASYILTGGSGTGKTVLELSLEKTGEVTIGETVEDTIKMLFAQGYIKNLGN